MMQFNPGSLVWIPCEVKPGPFSNERIIRVKTTQGFWVGFVETRFLETPIEVGATKVRAQVEGMKGGLLFILMPGHAMAAPKIVERERDQVTLASVQA